MCCFYTALYDMCLTISDTTHRLYINTPDTNGRSHTFFIIFYHGKAIIAREHFQRITAKKAKKHCQMVFRPQKNTLVQHGPFLAAIRKDIWVTTSCGHQNQPIFIKRDIFKLIFFAAGSKWITDFSALQHRKKCRYEFTKIYIYTENCNVVALLATILFYGRRNVLGINRKAQHQYKHWG